MTPEERAEKIVDWLSPTRIKHAVAAPSLLEQKIAAEIHAAVDEESALRMDWNYVIEELEAKVKSAETDCAERVRKAVAEVAIADCVKCRRGYGTWCEVCAIHEANANYRMGKAEAYEDAAKIAEVGPPPGGVVHVNGDVRDPGAVVTGFQKWIAARIRALKIGDGK